MELCNLFEYDTALPFRAAHFIFTATGRGVCGLFAVGGFLEVGIFIAAYSITLFVRYCIYIHLFDSILRGILFHRG